jgi:hypothetical protein
LSHWDMISTGFEIIDRYKDRFVQVSLAENT